jgi:hypothetical protein
MTEIEEIPQLYKTRTIELNGNKLEIKGFRGKDYAIVRSINKLANETLIIQTKANRIIRIKEEEKIKTDDEIKINELSDKQLQSLIQLKNGIEDINGKTQPLIEKLGQRGIKRAFNPELSTEKLDKIPDIELEYAFLKEVYEIMAEISSLPKSIGDDGKKPNI